ncbi:ATP-binding cassette domain-containing protein [Acidaminobacter sp. JC074]|uniref:ATP-binding cassette domain-containing protein n=1 Tax=Acidaminobacter sp. JC074 TaxID=2530199 RepID=UPI001F10DD1C|nr:ATP-binding cassette domain-containing protein [Acidaminobacter sp. JC074]MCH4889081.1 ATP-binding cassette domain-containing protein [Acidaminobacter sp. JC074]
MITIYPGYSKTNEPESFDRLNLEVGRIYSVVGPTGSGKTQLLDDIERLSPGDGVTGRKVISEIQPNIQHLSQKMHYMVDMSIGDFLKLYGESLSIHNLESYAQTIINLANTLCGEPITQTSQLTCLSGGQSRALMIATVAINPKANIILLDEIENAGINRLEVLNLLRTKGKIVIMITHDPLLALMADYRIALKNGSIVDMIHRSSFEASLIHDLTKIDDYIFHLRQSLRNGLRIEENYHAKVTME